ncbi:MAG: hypothetical protein ACXW61_07345 [Gemmatirosa sp.]
MAPERIPPLRRTRRRLGVALVGYTAGLGVLAAASSAPLRWPESPDVQWSLAPAVAGLLALQGAVLGALLAYARRRAGNARRGLALGAVLGAALELVRLAQDAVLRPLAPTPAALGAALAAVFVTALLRRWHARRAIAGILALDYPLVGAAYLALPVLWLGAQRPAGGGPPWEALAFALFGGSLAASVRASRGVAARGGVPGTALLVAGVAAAAALPLGVREPRPWLVGAAVVGLLAAAHAPRFDPGAAERRFEQRALRRALPLLALAIVLLVAAPLLVPAEHWSEAWTGAWRATPWLHVPDHGARLALLELVGAATLAGYVAAEWRARLEEARRHVWRRLAPWAIGAIAAAEAVRGLVPGDAAQLARALVALAAVRAGVALYHLQRDHVRALVQVGQGASRVLTVAIEGRGSPSTRPGYIGRSWHPNTPSSSTRAPWSAPSSAWPTRSSSSTRAPKG